MLLNMSLNASLSDPFALGTVEEIYIFIRLVSWGHNIYVCILGLNM